MVFIKFRLPVHKGILSKTVFAGSAYWTKLLRAQYNSTWRPK